MSAMAIYDPQMATLSSSAQDRHDYRSGQHFPLGSNWASYAECHAATLSQLQLARDKIYLPPFGLMSSQISSNSVQTLVLDFIISLQHWKKNGKSLSVILQNRLLPDAEPYCSPVPRTPGGSATNVRGAQLCST